MKTIALCLIVVASACALPRGRLPIPQPFTNRIVGGEDASPGELPYQISLQIFYWDSFYLYCGGSIYTENYIISAAHCVYANSASRRYRVLAGEHNLYVEEGNEQFADVESLKWHEDFDLSDFSNDIALLKLHTPLKFNDFVSSIAIPTAGTEYGGDVIVSGWGALEEGGTSPAVLQKVTVSIISDEDCRKRYGSDIIDSMICAKASGKDSCQGDSGGPLAQSGSLVGVVSWGYGCARPRSPGVYTEVSYFADWIASNSAN